MLMKIEEEVLDWTNTQMQRLEEVALCARALMRHDKATDTREELNSCMELENLRVALTKLDERICTPEQSAIIANKIFRRWGPNKTLAVLSVAKPSIVNGRPT